jgi:hypothetical protein
MLAAGYVVGLAAVAATVHYLLRRDGRERRPSDWVWTIASGVLWPVLLVGAIEAALIVFATRQLRRRPSGVLTEKAERFEDVLLVM